MPFETLKKFYDQTSSKLSGEEYAIIGIDPISQWAHEDDCHTLSKSIGKMPIKNIVSMSFEDLFSVRGMGETNRYFLCVLLERQFLLHYQIW